MNSPPLRRAQLTIGSISVAVGVFAILNSGFTFSGPGERGFLMGDTYFVSTLFRLNGIGGLALILAGALGIVGSGPGRARVSWLGAAVAGVGGIAVLINAGEPAAVVGAGNPSNAALLIMIAVGLATTGWAAHVTTPG